ncbi:MAG: hypothetical protein HYT71_00560 [Candidatus Aenigmarchaeota archaeon]|nr:hypothetical protein [Candidatus Aenigmarchaeota archaeon]
MKAVTPVIALVMLMLITVGIVGVSAAWFNAVFSSNTKNTILIPVGGAYCANSEIRVYALNPGDTTITSTDILVADVDGTSVLNSPFFGDMSGALVMYWKFDEALGSVASDSSGSGNDGTLIGNPIRESGKVNKALRFDGTLANYVAKSSFPNFPASEITAMFWMKTSDNTKAGTPISYASSSSSNDFLIYDYRNFYIGIKDNSLAGQSVTTGVSANDGQWHHIATTWKSAGGETKLYKDGVPAFPGATVSSGVAMTNGGTLIVAQEQDSVWTAPGGGVFDVTQAFLGTLDEVKIYNKATGTVSINPGKSGLLIDYPANSGKHSLRIGTSSGVSETSVTCA